MSDYDPDTTHDLLIKAFMEYSRWNTRFELFGYKDSALKARLALSEIRRLGKIRRAEILEKKNLIHGIQKGTPEEDTDDN